MIPELGLLSDKLASRVQTNKISLVSESESSFRIESQVEDSFPLSVSFAEGRYEIEAAWWHSDYEDPNQAFAAVCWLLTPYFRVVASFTQDEIIATWLESYTDQGWEATKYLYFVDPANLESPVENADIIKIQTQAVFLDSSFTTHFPAAHLDQAGYPLGTILGETSYERREDGWYPVGVPTAE